MVTRSGIDKAGLPPQSLRPKRSPRADPISPAPAETPSSLPPRLAIRSAPEAAAQALRNAIISGELKSGERILEQSWASRFGIGQPTLREALKELEHQGFLVKVPHRGTRVAQLGDKDFRQILEVRIPLEAIAIAKAAVNMTTDAERRMKSCVSQMAMAGESGDLIGFHESDVAFHREIWRLADNEYLRTSLESVCFSLFVFSVLGRGKEWFREAVKQHFGILRGICTRDPAAARESFVTETVRYWNARYGLELALDAPVFQVSESKKKNQR